MHKEILSPEQLNLLPLLQTLSHLGFFLVGGTAIALHLGHRRSIDFDLFTVSKYKKNAVISSIKKDGFKVQRTLYEDEEQLDLVVNDVKLTFLEYPFEIHPSLSFEQIITLPSLVNLASMKAYALGRRAKWKDYVDIFFVLQDICSLSDLIENTLELFGELFNQKLFREQLSYFEDIEYSEKIDYLPGYYVDDNSIRKFLVMQATEEM
jgi:hypothetical protein